MNRLLIILIFFSTDIICQPRDSKESLAGYRIEGHVLGLDEKLKIYLIDGGQRKKIDSAIVENNRFTLTGTLSEAAHMYLYLGKSVKLADILLDNRDVKVVGSAPHYDSVRVEGSDIDRQWKEWYRIDQKIGYQKYRLDKLYQSLVEKKDSVNAVIVKKLSDELLADRIDLLKSYVRRYNDTASGAVLPTLCTIQESLTQSDYLEMYNFLTPRMRSTVFGQEILTLSRKSKLK